MSQVILRRTAEIAMIGFEVQDLTTELGRLRESQQSQQTDQNIAPGNQTSSPAVKVVSNTVMSMSIITHYIIVQQLVTQPLPNYLPSHRYTGSTA